MKKTYFVTCAAVVLAAASLLPPGATAQEVQRLTTFPAALQGTWAETPDKCSNNDKSNVVIESAQYSDSIGSCAVQWIIQLPPSLGYNVRGLCTSADDPNKSDGVNIVVRPEAGGRTWIAQLGVPLAPDPTTGRLPKIHTTYQHCSTSTDTGSDAAKPNQQ